MPDRIRCTTCDEYVIGEPLAHRCKPARPNRSIDKETAAVVRPTLRVLETDRKSFPKSESVTGKARRPRGGPAERPPQSTPKTDPQNEPAVRAFTRAALEYGLALVEHGIPSDATARGERALVDAYAALTPASRAALLSDDGRAGRETP